MFARRFTVSLAGTALTAAALGMATLGLAGTANAASADKEFLAAIEQAGISYDNPQQVIKVAKNVCAALDDGTTADEILSELTEQNDLSTKQGKTFIVDAVQAYCPEYLQEN